MDTNEVRQWAQEQGLPDSWVVRLENEAEERADLFTLNEAERLLNPDWRLAILNSDLLQTHPQPWIALDYKKKATPLPVPKIETPRALVLVAPAIPTAQPEAHPSKRNLNSTATVLSVFGILIFIVGGLMVAGGLLASAQESQLAEPSAIRGIENVLEYGIGFMVFSLGLLLCGVSALLRK